MPAEAIRVPLRWRDLDHQGHVYHGAFLTLLDEARVEWLARTLGGPFLEAHVIARIEIDYVSELRHQDKQANITFRVERIGTSSLSTMETISARDGRVAARARTVLVAWHQTDRHRRNLSSHERNGLEKLLERNANDAHAATIAGLDVDGAES